MMQNNHKCTKGLKSQSQKRIMLYLTGDVSKDYIVTDDKYEFERSTLQNSVPDCVPQYPVCTDGRTDYCTDYFYNCHNAAPRTGYIFFIRETRI